jgi:ribonuclease HII
MKKYENYDWIIGIDEVGRGPLAGPVSVGLFAVNALGQQIRKNSDNIFKNLMKNFAEKVKITDSKKMSHADRVKTYDFFHKNLRENSHLFYFNVMHKSASEIDKKGIAVCINQLVEKQISNFSKKYKTGKIYAFMDGGLKTKKCECETIIKGDLKVQIIGAASIIAKVTRDKLMSSLAKKHPKYDLEIHKGYGTKKHIQKIRENGPSLLHRKTFITRILAIK